MHCQWCGGKLGRDCYSPFECEAFARDMYERGRQEQQAYEDACHEAEALAAEPLTDGALEAPRTGPGQRIGRTPETASDFTK